jgi:hypothetical protein
VASYIFPVLIFLSKPKVTTVLVKNFKSLSSRISKQGHMTAPDFQSDPVAHYSLETIETLVQAEHADSHTAKLYDRRGQ